MSVDKAILAEASALAEHWRKLYVRTGLTPYLRTAEVLGTLRAAVIDKPAPPPPTENTPHEHTE